MFLVRHVLRCFFRNQWGNGPNDEVHGWKLGEPAVCTAVVTALFLALGTSGTPRSKVYLISSELLDFVTFLLRSYWLVINPFHAQKVSVFGVILVRIFPAFSLIRTEYGEILRISPYSVQMLENAGEIRTRITPNTDTFYPVFDTHWKHQQSKDFLTLSRGVERNQWYEMSSRH